MKEGDKNNFLYVIKKGEVTVIKQKKEILKLNEN
jgi:hypothetical protein